MNVNINYYDVLGVPSTASSDDIRTAYRTMAKRYHPDLNKEAGAEDKFKLVNEANDILSNVESKVKYDSARMMNTGFSGFSYQRPRHDPRQYAENILVRNKDINITYHITLEEAFSGKEAVINYRPNRASSAPGTIEIANATIPKACDDGYKLIIPGKGDDTNTKIKPGNLIITVKVSPHPLYRKGELNSLHMDLSVDVFDLITGTDFLVTLIDGGDIKLKIKKGTQPGSVLKIPKRGWPDRYGNRGDVLITINTVIPVLTDEQENELIKFVDSLKK